MEVKMTMEEYKELEVAKGNYESLKREIRGCAKVYQEAGKITNKNKKLEEEIIEKDKGLEFLNGRIDGMEYVIEHLNLKIGEEK